MGIPGRRAYKYFFQRKRYLIFKKTNKSDVDQWMRGKGGLFNASKMTTVDLIRLPVEYKPIPIRHFIFFGRAYPELQGHETTSGAITPISQKILDKQNSHFDLKNLYGIDTTQKIIRNRWSGAITKIKYRKKNDQLLEDVYESGKLKLLTVLTRNSIVTESMEVKNIIPGVRNWLLLSKNEKQLVFAEESKICSSFASQSLFPLTSLYWKFGAQSPVWFNRFNFLFLAYIILYPIIELGKAFYEDTTETYGQLYIPEALYFDNEWWSDEPEDQQKQMKCMTARTEHEKLGRDLIMLNIPDNDARIGNERLVSPNVKYFDNEFIADGFSGVYKTFNIYLKNGLRGLKLGNLKIVHRQDKIIFRFERSIKHSNGKTENESSLLVLYLEEKEFDGESFETVKKIGYFPGGKFVPDSESIISDCEVLPIYEFSEHLQKIHRAVNFGFSGFEETTLNKNMRTYQFCEYYRRRANWIKTSYNFLLAE